MGVYLAGRYLNMSERKWKKLPWHLQRLYMEGFEQEGIISNGQNDNDSEYQDLAGADMDSLKALGFDVD